MRPASFGVGNLGKLKTTHRIYDVAKEIEDGKYLLPSIQRSFVWEEERICKLLDSLMNDYPIGSLLVWAPPPAIKVRSRPFQRNHETGDRLLSEPEETKGAYLVLDGQQRLQALFITFFGTYDGKRAYFKLDCDPGKEENGLRYPFQFLTDAEAAEEPRWVRPKDIVEIPIEGILDFVEKHYTMEPKDTRERMSRNLGKFIRVFDMAEKLVVLDIEESLSYNDVLEVFVRVNSGGVVLTKSDLVFSTVVLKIPEMERLFLELVDQLNFGGEFEFDLDFLVKTSFVLLDLGAKYDVEKLENSAYLSRLKTEFPSMQRALLSTLEFLKSDAKILSKRFLKSDLALIPIVEYAFRQPHQHFPEGQSGKLRQYLYMSFFQGFYSYGPDSKLDALSKKLVGTKDFPLAQISEYIAERTKKPYGFVPEMLGNLDLVLNIVAEGKAEIPKVRGWSLERDHIFPHSTLKKLGIPEAKANSVGNLRLLNKTRNILKSAEVPPEDLEYFGSDDSELKRLFLDARRDLTNATFGAFVERREAMMLDRVCKFLGLPVPKVDAPGASH